MQAPASAATTLARARRRDVVTLRAWCITARNAGTPAMHDASVVPQCGGWIGRRSSGHPGCRRVL
jgi:hypothetical protein